MLAYVWPAVCTFVVSRLVVSAGSLYPVSCSVAWILIDLTTFCILFIARFTIFVTFDDFRFLMIFALIRADHDLIFYALKGFFNCNNLY